MKKVFNSKNLSKHVESLLLVGKVDLAMDILRAKELKTILPNILNLLERKRQRNKDKSITKIYSKTDIDKLIIKKLENTLQVDMSETQIIIDEAMSPGVKIRSKDLSVDATLDTMLQNAIEKIIKNK